MSDVLFKPPEVATLSAYPQIAPIGLDETMLFGEQSYRCLETVDAELRLLQPNAKG